MGWVDIKIKGKAKAALLEKRDEARDLKARMERFSGIIRRYIGESSDLKEHVSKLKGHSFS